MDVKASEKINTIRFYNLRVFIIWSENKLRDKKGGKDEKSFGFFIFDNLDLWYVRISRSSAN